MKVLAEDLVLEGDSLILAEEGLAEVKGKVICEGSCTVKGSLLARDVRVEGSMYVDGDLSVNDTVEVEGRLQVKGSLNARRVRVDDSCRVEGLIKAEEVSVGGILDCREIEAGAVKVGGTFRVEKGRACNVNVGGAIEFSQLQANKVSVGGYLEGGKAKAERLSVGSNVRVDNLEADNVSVGGSLQLIEGRLGRVSVGGTARVGGSLKVSVLSVGGMVKIGGELESEEVTVGGILTIARGGRVNKRITVGGTLESRGLLKADELTVGGLTDVEKLVARIVKVVNLRTAAGVQAEVFRLSKKGRVEGPVVTKEFVMEDGGWAQEVYAKFFECGERCRVQRLYAERAFIGRGSTVEAVFYVEELKLEEGAKVRKEEKISEIKPPEGFTL